MNRPDRVQKKLKPTWSDVKAALGVSKRQALHALIADLYRLSQENRDFLHARFSLGDDPLAPYKELISKAVYPDVMRNRPFQIAVAKSAISQYKRAIGDDRGLLELMVYFVEEGNQFTVDCGDIDEPFYLAMLRMYDAAIGQLLKLDDTTIREPSPGSGRSWRPRRTLDGGITTTSPRCTTSICTHTWKRPNQSIDSYPVRPRGWGRTGPVLLAGSTYRQELALQTSGSFV
jgi:hypothetical protein